MFCVCSIGSITYNEVLCDDLPFFFTHWPFCVTPSTSSLLLFVFEIVFLINIVIALSLKPEKKTTTTRAIHNEFIRGIQSAGYSKSHTEYNSNIQWSKNIENVNIFLWIKHLQRQTHAHTRIRYAKNPCDTVK